jgi:hypothetical protein
MEEYKMVKGDWIVNIKDMRCKNWVNGIEVVFYLNKEKLPVGKIQHIPEKLLEGKSLTIDLVFFLYKMWTRASAVFYKAYYRQHGPAVLPGYLRWSGNYRPCFQLYSFPQTGRHGHGSPPQSGRHKRRTGLKPGRGK